MGRAQRVRSRASLALVLAAAVAAGCGSSGGPGGPSAAAAGSGTPTPGATPAAVGSPGADDATCASATAPAQHQSPAIEALLPANVLGRPLYRWSVVGRCWLALTVGAYPGGVDGFLADLQGTGSPIPLNLDHLVYGVAGRSDTTTDPPYFVFGAARPQDDAEIQLAMFLLFGGASYVDVQSAPDLSQYEQRSIAGKDVYVGTPSMVEQSTHQRGQPYLYETDGWMFLVITDDEAWATDAISQLP